MSEHAVQIVTRGTVTDADRDYAEHRLTAVLHRVGTTVHPIVVKLTHEPDPARERPHLAQITIDLPHHVLRAHADGGTMMEAVDRLNERVRDQLQHLADR